MSLFWWLLGAGCALAGFVVYGQMKWRSLTDQMREQLEAPATQRRC